MMTVFTRLLLLLLPIHQSINQSLSVCLSVIGRKESVIPTYKSLARTSPPILPIFLLLLPHLVWSDTGTREERILYIYFYIYLSIYLSIGRSGGWKRRRCFPRLLEDSVIMATENVPSTRYGKSRDAVDGDPSTINRFEHPSIFIFFLLGI